MDWLATAIGLLASYLVGKDIKYGWLLMALNSAICVAINFKSGLVGMAVGSCCYAVLELVGFIRTHRKLKANPDKYKP